MSENLSEVAGILSGAPMAPEPEKAPTPEPETPPVETPEPAIGAPETPQLPAAAADPAERQSEPLTVKALAEKLEVRPQDIYQDLMIDVGAGEQLSLSQIKDQGAKLHKAEKILSDAETHRTGVENELLRREHAASLIQPTPEQQAAADQHWQQFVLTENTQAMRVISAWADPVVQRADLEEMATMLTGYGKHPAEVARFADHRDVKQLYDHLVLKRRFERAAAAEVTKTPAPVGKSKRKSAAKPGRKAVADFEAGKLSETEAIAALIAEG